MKRYDRYEDGTVIDKQQGENNLLELIREGDMVELQIFKLVKYFRIYDGYDATHVRNRLKQNDKNVFLAIWFRSGNTMTRYELKGESK